MIDFSKILSHFDNESIMLVIVIAILITMIVFKMIDKKYISKSNLKYDNINKNILNKLNVISKKYLNLVSESGATLIIRGFLLAAKYNVISYSMSIILRNNIQRDSIIIKEKLEKKINNIQDNIHYHLTTFKYNELELAEYLGLDFIDSNAIFNFINTQYKDAMIFDKLDEFLTNMFDGIINTVIKKL